MKLVRAKRVAETREQGTYLQCRCYEQYRLNARRLPLQTGLLTSETRPCVDHFTSETTAGEVSRARHPNNSSDD
jgi:hypothetical protein